jgi:hypothetical protein
MYEKNITTAAIVIGVPVLLLCIVITCWYFRPNRAEVNPKLDPEVWTVVSDGEHNSNTDLIYFRGGFFLVHASSPYHMGTAKSKLVIRRSPDARK